MLILVFKIFIGFAIFALLIGFLTWLFEKRR